MITSASYICTDKSCISESWGHASVLYNQSHTKEKHICKYCSTNSEITDKRGNCVSCGAPFGEDIPNCAWGIIDNSRAETMGSIMKKIDEQPAVEVRGGINNNLLYTYIRNNLSKI